MDATPIITMNLDPLTCAKMLYKEAVILFFEKREPLAIYYLANHAREILEVINKKKSYMDTNYLTAVAREQLLVYKRDLLQALNTNQVREPVLQFDPQVNEFLLFECALIFNEDIDPHFLFSKVYLIWMMAMYAEFFVAQFTAKILAGEAYQIDPYDFDLMLSFLKP